MKTYNLKDLRLYNTYFIEDEKIRPYHIKQYFWVWLCTEDDESVFVELSVEIYGDEDYFDVKGVDYNKAFNEFGEDVEVEGTDDEFESLYGDILKDTPRDYEEFLPVLKKYGK